MIEIRHLKTMSALRDTGSLVDAAERVFLTQSALSHQLKDLEDKLDCTLFIRKTKPIRFTSAGQKLLHLADEILPQLKQTEREIQRLAGGETGRLNIAIECHSCFDWLMPTINGFRENWPEVEIDLSAGFSFIPLPALQRGDLDLVITSNPQDINGICYIPLFRYESVLAISNLDPLNEKTYITAQDLADKMLITYPVETERLDVFQHILDPADISPAGIRHADLTVMMVQLIASGRGVSALPNWAIAPYLAQDLIRCKSFGTDGLWCSLYAAIREDQKDAAYMKDFIQTAHDTCFETLKGIRVVQDS